MTVQASVREHGRRAMRRVVLSCRTAQASLAQSLFLCMYAAVMQLVLGLSTMHCNVLAVCMQQRHSGNALTLLLQGDKLCKPS